MRTRAAVLESSENRPPYSATRPLEVVELDIEKPRRGEVLVQIEAAGLCHSDLSVVNGDRPRPTPMVLGHEGAGRVVEVGPGVEDLVAGQRVVSVFVPRCGACEMCATGRPALCTRAAVTNTAGEMPSGGFRWRLGDGRPVHHHLGISAFTEFAVIDRRSLVAIPDDLPPETAALFGCAVMTGAGAVLNTANVRAGTSVAIFGLGGVGLAAVIGAVVAGAWPVAAVDPVREKRQAALQLGATHAFKPDEAVEAIADLTAGGAENAFEAVGKAAVLRAAWDATCPGGRTISVGLANPTEELRLPAVQIVGQARQLIGSYLGDSVPVRDIPRFIRLWRSGNLPVEHLRSATLPLDGINAALENLANGTAVRQMIMPAS